VLIRDKKAYGVKYLKSGKTHELLASREVILSAGSINSPQLLQLSGVGPKKILEQVSVPLVHDSPAVGENLQDHLGVSYFYKSKVPTLNDRVKTGSW
jgi:choline dehydrogenase